MPRIIEQRPRRGFHHPAGIIDIRELLIDLGALGWYGLDEIVLAQRSSIANDQNIEFGYLSPPGKIVLYEQAPPPWLVRASRQSLQELERAGAVLTASTLGDRHRVDWPGTTLRDFMLYDVLLHELGHHIAQQFKGKRLVQVMRTSDHELFADTFARRIKESMKMQRIVKRENFNE